MNNHCELPTADQAYKAATSVMSEHVLSALELVRREINKSSASGIMNISMDVSGWNVTTRNVVVKRLLFDGYLDVKIYHGCQRDPCCNLTFNFAVSQL